MLIRRQAFYAPKALGSVTLALVVGLVACSPGQDQNAPEPASTPESSSEEESAVLDAYQSAREVYVAALRGDTEPEALAQDLESYATGQAYEALVEDGRTFSDARIVFEGEPGMEPQVTGVDMEASPAHAVLTDCWDTTTWQPMRDGTPLESAPDQNERQILNIRAERHDGTWLVSELTPEEGRTC